MLERAGVPTARALPVARPPCVVKADGLATGKGVFVCHADDEMQAALAEVQALGTRFHIEELLEGEELSVFAVCDGRRAVPLAAARDFKRAGDGDAGPNTGGMGAFSPVPGSPLLDRLVAEIHRPVLAELAARDAPFSGLLYAGLMLTADGPRVLEFNCRFGDPETQAVLPLISSDLLPVLAEAAAGDLGSSPIELSGDTAVTVVVAGEGLPGVGRHRVTDHRDRGSDEARRARLPCRHGRARPHARDERRANPRRHGRRPRISPPRASSRTRPSSESRFPAPGIVAISVADTPLVGILIGSESDLPRMQPALDDLQERGIPFELKVLSAHRQPDAVAAYAKRPASEG